MYVSENQFYQLKCNGEKIQRDWLTLSPSALVLFCCVCKLFSQTMSGTDFETGSMQQKGCDSIKLILTGKLVA